MPTYVALFERAGVPDAAALRDRGLVRRVIDAVVPYGDEDALAAHVQAYLDAGAVRGRAVAVRLRTGSGEESRRGDGGARCDRTRVSATVPICGSRSIRTMFARLSASEYDSMAELFADDIEFDLAYAPESFPMPVDRP